MKSVWSWMKEKPIKSYTISTKCRERRKMKNKLVAWMVLISTVLLTTTMIVCLVFPVILAIKTGNPLNILYMGTAAIPYMILDFLAAIFGKG